MLTRGVENMAETLSDDPNDYCFVDSETRALKSAKNLDGDVTKVGIDVYKENAFPVMWTYTIGHNPTTDIMALDDGFDERLEWDIDASDDLKRFHDRAEAGKAWYVAHNMGFDRQIWNCPESDFPEMRTDMAIDNMVQGASSGLPGKLEHAGRSLGLGGKEAAGGNLIQVFAPAHGETSLTRPDLWKSYKKYGIRDTALLRDVFFATRPLPRVEWEDYWVNDRINQRGMAMDVEFARRAAAVAEFNIQRINAALVRATNGQITKVTQAARIKDFIYDRLDSAEARDLMVKEWDLDSEDDRKPAKISLEKSRMEALEAYFENKKDMTFIDDVTKEVLEHRLYGGSSSPAKFAKMLRMQLGEILRNQYVFNGAGQTGRYSSRGAQLHNLMRKSLGEKEIEFINLIMSLDLY